MLADDLGADLEDGGSPLVQRFNQPFCCPQTLAQVIFVGLAARRPANPGVIAVVDQHAGEGFGVEFDDHPPLGCSRIRISGTTG